jgi:FAD synthase
VTAIIPTYETCRSGEIEDDVRRLLNRVFAEMLTDCLQMRALHVGGAFALGADRAGTPVTLRAVGLHVCTHPLVMAACDGETVSSSSIRRRIARANPHDVH